MHFNRRTRNLDYIVHIRFSLDTVMVRYEMYIYVIHVNKATQLGVVVRVYIDRTMYACNHCVSR